MYVFFGVGAVLAICAGVLYWRKNHEFHERIERIENDVGQRVRASFVARVSEQTANKVDRLRRHLQTAGKLCANKGAILVYTFQVIYQYASIVTGYEFNFDYPEPAKSAAEFLSMFGLNILSLSPPECINPESNFYTRVLITSQGPLGIIIVGVILVCVYNCCRPERERVELHHTCAYVLAFLEFVLSGVATVVCKTFVCEDIEGEGKVLIEQPTLLCEDLEGNVSHTHQMWKLYSGIMIVIYPVGVPLLILVSLVRQQKKIKRVMKAKKFIEVGEIDELPRDYFSDDSERELSARLREESQTREDEFSVEEIAHRDSIRRQAQRRSSPSFARDVLLLRQLPSSYPVPIVVNNRGAQSIGDLAAIEDIDANVVDDDASLGITWRAVRGDRDAVAVKSVHDDRRAFATGTAPRPGDRLLRVGETDVAEIVARAIDAEPNNADKAANDTVQRLVRDALARSAAEREAHGGPAMVALQIVRAERQVSRLLLSMSHTFEKFEPDSYWFGVYLLTVRLLETSMLVFFKKRTTKAMVATAVSVISLLIAQKYNPWLRDSDDKVRTSVRAHL